MGSNAFDDVNITAVGFYCHFSPFPNAFYVLAVALSVCSTFTWFYTVTACLAARPRLLRYRFALVRRSHSFRVHFRNRQTLPHFGANVKRLAGELVAINGFNLAFGEH